MGGSAARRNWPVRVTSAMCRTAGKENQMQNWQGRRLLKDEEGQDLVEYTLLLAFVCLASAALFINAGGSMSTIWTVANNYASNAASVAAS